MPILGEIDEFGKEVPKVHKVPLSFVAFPVCVCPDLWWAGGQSSCHWRPANEEASGKSCRRTCWQFLGVRVHSWNAKKNN